MKTVVKSEDFGEYVNNFAIEYMSRRAEELGIDAYRVVYNNIRIFFGYNKYENRALVSLSADVKEELDDLTTVLTEMIKVFTGSQNISVLKISDDVMNNCIIAANMTERQIVDMYIDSLAKNCSDARSEKQRVR